VHLLFEKASGLTETIIGGAIEVHRDKGPGLLESVYEWCLLKELDLRGLDCMFQFVKVDEQADRNIQQLHVTEELCPMDAPSCSNTK
jgi:GxxExxY protein